MSRNRASLAALGAVLLASTALLEGAAGAVPARLPQTSTPSVQLSRIVRTAPFVGSSRSVRDHEGSAYVGRDRSMWIADDIGNRIHEVNVRTGRLRRTIGADALADVRPRGGGKEATRDRVGDLEGMAYDRRHDKLFIFSGSCCTAEAQPTVFRLSRGRGGKLRPDSYQPLPAGSDFTAAAWSSADRQLYVGADRLLWSYRYARNVVGPPIAPPGIEGLMGMTFTGDGRGLLVAHSRTVVSLLDWPTRTLVPGWTFDLAGAGVLDARGVELARGRMWVSDGFDFRPAGDPRAHALFVFDVE